MRLLLLAALAAVLAAVYAGAGLSAHGHDGMLYGCVYFENLGNSSNVDVLVWDKHAPHARGWAMVRGTSGYDETQKFTLDQHGWHISKFNVTSFDDYAIDVGLYKPKLDYKFSITLNAANDLTTKGCKPH